MAMIDDRLSPADHGRAPLPTWLQVIVALLAVAIILGPSFAVLWRS
jgi:hypothetical protein